MTRAWFRRRLDADPRRWVVLLAALGGLAAFSLELAGRPDLLKAGPTLAIWCGLAALSPSMGVLGMLVHGRLLWWTGRVLGGRARPHEIHAAFAWSELPFVVAAAPLIAGVPLVIAGVHLDPGPSALRTWLDRFDVAAGALVGAAALAALAGAVVYVGFVAEAQGFRWRRALANHVLAAAAGVALLAGAAAVAWVFARLA